MNRYEEAAKRLADANNIDGLVQMMAGQPCGCMGPIDGEPECPCRMAMNAAKKHLKIEVVK